MNNCKEKHHHKRPFKKCTCYDDTISMTDFFLEEYEKWLAEQQISNQQIVEDDNTLKPGHRFTWGDCVPKQGYKTYQKYISEI